MAKESPKAQELGPKRYKKLVDSSNKFYDDHMAGRRDPRTGEYYNKISFENPAKNTSLSSVTLADFECDCSKVLSIKRTTAAIICNGCSKFFSVSVNPLSDEITINGQVLE